MMKASAPLLEAAAEAPTTSSWVRRSAALRTLVQGFHAIATLP